MNEPKFHIGQAVAVCTTSLNTIIPNTVVTAVKWEERGLNRDPCTMKISMLPCGYIYRVQGDDYWITEWCLRPINPDEYLDIIEELFLQGN